MKPSSKRALSFLAIAVFLLGALIIYVGLIRPEYNAIVQLRAILVAKDNLFQEQNSAISQVEDLIAQYQGTVRLQDVISSALPLQGAVAALFSQIEAISRVGGSALQSFELRTLAIRPPKVPNPLVKGVGVLQFSVRLLSSYESLKTFLRSLETNIRLMDLVNLKIEQAGKPNQDLYGYNLTVDVYYQAD